MVNNPKIQALVISNLGNEIYNSYGKAFGIEPAVLGNIGTITMDTEGHGNTSNSSNISTLETLYKNLKPIAPSNTAAANSKIEKDLIQIKRTIDEKGPFMDMQS